MQAPRSTAAGTTASTKDVVFSVTGSAGYIDGWGGDDVRINDRFFKGGNTFRGFETAGIGPRDTSLDRATRWAASCTPSAPSS